MRLRFFSIPALAPEQASEEVSTFLSTHRVLGIDRRFVDAGADSYWAICVTYTATKDAGNPARRSKKVVDYREVLSEPEFAAPEA